MNFTQKLKAVDSIPYVIEKLSPYDIYAQYNPDRFKLWKKTCVGVIGNQFLDMKFSPHFALLKLYEDNGDSIKGKMESTPYYKMHRNYGKSDDWTKSKIKTFLNIYKDIKSNGIKEPPTILTSPIVKNSYNESYEIFEGHHRCAIAYFLEHKKIDCRLKTV